MIFEKETVKNKNYLTKKQIAKLVIIYAISQQRK